ncbi:hypothetical protein [Saccharothrix hoggarensis]|uniref:Uncharacterized protein n=1 Tax=Saccharothrix hoggarensis TaxID=913853 RepID=A0ABW3QLP0_9PSEU
MITAALLACWRPSGANRTREDPAVGTLLAYDHRAWHVVEIRRLPEERWDDLDRAMIAEWGPAAAPRIAVLHAADPAAAAPGVAWLRWWPSRTAWWVYPSPHYPVCAHCGEPHPCRAAEAAHLAAQEIARAARYEHPDVCPECGGHVESHHRPLRFDRNIIWPGGPPVSFHGNRKACRRAAEAYAARMSAVSAR